MKKVLAFMLAVVMVMSMAVPAAALASPGATAEDLLPVITQESEVIVDLHSTEDVLELHEDIQEVMAEAKEALVEAVPEGFSVLYFFYVEIIGAEEIVSVDFETIEETVGTGGAAIELYKAIRNGEVVFKQFIDGKWVVLEFKINEDGTVTVFGVTEAPIAVFIK